MTGVGIGSKESPFVPGRPVPLEYFVARHKEIERLERSIRQTQSGRNENIFIVGERGIGKSSLAWYAHHLAENEALLGAYCSMGSAKSLEDVVGIVFQRLLEGCDKSTFEKLKDAFRKYIKSINLPLFGVEFTDHKSDLRDLVLGFIPMLKHVCEVSKENGKKGLFVVMDDLNGVTDLFDFSMFLKSTVDGIATSRSRIPLFLILVGIPDRRLDMVKHQPSVARIFNIIDLPLIDESESREFFGKTFMEESITVSSEALALMVQLSGGYPMLMHEVGDAVFWQDSDNRIDVSDAKQGIMEAARTVGKKYIDPQISKVLKSKTYSSILWRVGKKLPLGGAFKRQELLKEIPANEQKNLDNFLNRIKKLGIVDEADVRGEYRFVNPLFHLYVWYEAKSKAGK
jgi:AAA+ ATPase superfamily predicted ATPase